MLEELGKFMNRHPFMSMIIIAVIGDTISKTAYIHRTGKMPNDFEIRFDTKQKPVEEERNKHGF